MNPNELSKKTVLILGAGKTGLSAAKFLKDKASKILISDSNQISKETEAELKSLQKNSNIEIEFGNNSERFLKQANLVVISPGISPFTEIVQKIHGLEIPIIADIELAGSFIKKPKIAVTGTNGKTTTTLLIAHVLQKSGKKAISCGNIGKPILDVIEEDNLIDFYVIEASSYQIFYSPTFSADIAICLNITPDHLDWHRTLEHYIESKKKLFNQQKTNSWSILNLQDNVLKNFTPKTNVFYFSCEPILKTKFSNIAFIEDNILKLKNKDKLYNLTNKYNLKIIGNHNIENALASAACAYISNTNISDIKHGLETFEGVEHRLEFVRYLNNKEFYNDSKATNPESTIKAIEAINAYKHGKKITLILGGRDKHTDLTQMINIIKKYVQNVIIYGESRDRFAHELNKNHFNKEIRIVNNINEAITEALNSNTNIVLFSPACASFDMFKNYEERGRIFKEIVSKLH